MTLEIMKGQTLIELLLAISLTAIILPAILTGLVASRSGKVQQNQRLEAVALLKEAQEAVRNVREKDWNTFAVDGTFHPAHPGSSWQLDLGSELVNGFTRQVEISPVERDSDPTSPTYGQIVTTGGTLDPSTKKVVTTILWTSPIASSITSTTYIVRLDNITYTETLEAEFNAGTKTGVAVTNTSGGEIKLAPAGGRGDWCNPAIPSATLDLTGQSVAKSITAIEGRAFVGTGQNASGHALYNVTISNDYPPNLNELGIYDDSGLKTNGVFGESHYAYLATDKNSTEVVILDVATSTPTLVGTIDTSGPTDADSVFWSDDYLYVTTGSKLYVYDVTDRANPIAKGNITLAGTGNKIYVVNHIAYVAIGSTTTQLQIVDATDPANLISTPAMKIGVNDKPGKDVFVNPEGTRTYLVTSISSSNSEFFIINTQIKDSLSTLANYDAKGMDPRALTIPEGSGIAIIVGYGGEEYQALEILNDIINYCGGIDTADNINGVSSVLEEDEDAWAYIITDNASKEMQAIEGGPGTGGGGSYASSGDFESQTIPIPMPVNETSFNRFEVTVNRPSDTDIKFRVAVAKAAGGSCTGASFTFVGEDGTASDFFETSVTLLGIEKFDYAIPTAINPGQCLRYKIFLSTTNSSQTPIFYDITVNYAP